MEREQSGPDLKKLGVLIILSPLILWFIFATLNINGIDLLAFIPLIIFSTCFPDVMVYRETDKPPIIKRLKEIFTYVTYFILVLMYVAAIIMCFIAPTVGFVSLSALLLFITCCFCRK